MIQVLNNLPEDEYFTAHSNGFKPREGKDPHFPNMKLCFVKLDEEFKYMDPS